MDPQKVYCRGQFFRNTNETKPNCYQTSLPFIYPSCLKTFFCFIGVIQLNELLITKSCRTAYYYQDSLRLLGFVSRSTLEKGISAGLEDYWISPAAGMVEERTGRGAEAAPVSVSFVLQTQLIKQHFWHDKNKITEVVKSSKINVIYSDSKKQQQCSHISNIFTFQLPETQSCGIQAMNKFNCQKIIKPGISVIEISFILLSKFLFLHYNIFSSKEKKSLIKCQEEV